MPYFPLFFRWLGVSCWWSVRFWLAHVLYTCPPRWGFGYLLYAVFYKHAAPLGLNAAEFAVRYRSWGRGFLAQRVGRPNPYGCSFGCSRFQFFVPPVSWWGPVAPSGAKYTNTSAIVGARFTSPDGFGEPNPYVYSFVLLTFQFSRLLYPGGTCRPSGALVICLYAVFYKHGAPLGLNATQLAARYPS